MDLLQSNLARYREARRPYVGGSYGERRAEILGRVPQLSVAYFDAYTQLKQAAAGTNFFGTSERKLSNVAVGGEDIQLILRLQKPVYNLSQISIPLVHPVTITGEDFTVDHVGPPDIGFQSVGMYVRPVGALKVPLGEGETWGLDALTYANAAYGDETAGKLYADPARYTKFPSGSDRIWEATESGSGLFDSISEPASWSAGVSSRSHLCHWIEGVADIANAVGPFYGLHFAGQWSDEGESEMRGILGEADQYEALAFVLGIEHDVVADTPL